MESFIYSLNATVPVFLLMISGWIFRKIGLVDEHFCKVSDKLVFKVTLPALLISDLASTDILHNFDVKFVLFCAGSTTIAIAVIWCGAKLLITDKKLVGEFVQASYRSSAAVLGCSFIMNIYGTTGMAPLMIIGSVPIYNICAVLILTLESPISEEQEMTGKQIKKAFLNILKNPIILGILLGAFLSVINITISPVLDKTLTNLASLTTPLALISIGASFKGQEALSEWRLSATASTIKLLILPAIFLPFAVYFGFRDQKMVALIVMLGSVTTPSSYIMAKNMGHKGILTASAIAITTVLSAITLTFWIFLMRYKGYIM